MNQLVIDVSGLTDNPLLGSLRKSLRTEVGRGDNHVHMHIEPAWPLKMDDKTPGANKDPKKIFESLREHEPIQCTCRITPVGSLAEGQPMKVKAQVEALIREYTLLVRLEPLSLICYVSESRA